MTSIDNTDSISDNDQVKIDENQGIKFGDTNSVNNDITVRSLLDILQGAVPYRGAIFIATTNNIEKIKEICPELIRGGRLTPVHFGYAEYDTLQEISMHYYKRTLDIPKDSIMTVCTATIIEFIMIHKNEIDYDFDKFNTYILEHLTLQSKICDIVK